MSGREREPLAYRVKPLPAECFESWLRRVADRHETTRKALFGHLGLETALADHDLASSADFAPERRIAIVGRLAWATAVPEKAIMRTFVGCTTQLLTIEAQWAVKITSLDDILARAARTGGQGRFMRNERSGKVALLIPDRPWLDEDGHLMKVWKLYRQGRSSLIPQNDLEESHWVDIDAATFTPLWQAEADNVAQHPHVERFFLATGRLLPIWNLLGEDAQVRRLVTQEGRSLLGRIVPVDAVSALLDKLGLGSTIQLTASEIVSAALAGKVVPINAARGLNLKRSRVNGEQRLEILGFDARALPAYKAKGCFTEIIQFQCRLFVPVHTANDILEHLAA